MQQIFSFFWRLCLLRAGPEQIPASGFVLGVTFAVYAVLSLVTMLITEQTTFLLMVASMLIGVAVEAATLYSLLLYKHVPGRFVPTLVALLGTTSVILLIMLPANMIFVNVDSRILRIVAGALFLSTFVWRLAISGAILSKAARISMLQGAAVMFVMEMMALSINRGLIPMAG